MGAFGEDPTPMQLAALLAACGQETAEACLTGPAEIASLHRKTATPESADFCGVIADRRRLDSPEVRLASNAAEEVLFEPVRYIAADGRTVLVISTEVDSAPHSSVADFFRQHSETIEAVRSS